MPTDEEREYYRMGFEDGLGAARRDEVGGPRIARAREVLLPRGSYGGKPKRKVKRKLSPWQKFVKANSKKPRFRLRSGSPNLKKLAVAFRKTPAGRKKKRR